VGDKNDKPFAARVGVDPLTAVFAVEKHDEAYYIWRNAGLRNQILVHIDAHHDMWWVNDESAITIANFICPALKQDFFQQVFWIVPDLTFEDTKSLKAMHRHLGEIIKKYPKSSRIVVENRRITATVYDKKLTVCPIRLLPSLQEPVLLDIDIDYFVIPKVS
jgi:hypothetical protein